MKAEVYGTMKIEVYGTLTIRSLWNFDNFIDNFNSFLIFEIVICISLVALFCGKIFRILWKRNFQDK